MEPTNTNNIEKKVEPLDESKTLLKPKKKHGYFYEILKFALIAVLIVIPFRIFIAQPFIVSGESMHPTFINGEYLIIDELTYQFQPPARESVLIFRYPNDTSKFFIKRVIGLPGETVIIKNGIVTIKNQKNPDGITLPEPYIGEKIQDNLEKILGADEYFVLGDNRLQSYDSRYWGVLNKKYIVGRPILRLMPLTRFGIFPGDYSN